MKNILKVIAAWFKTYCQKRDYEHDARDRELRIKDVEKRFKTSMEGERVYILCNNTPIEVFDAEKITFAEARRAIRKYTVIALSREGIEA